MGLTKSLEETIEHRRGWKPPLMMRRRTKPWRGDRVVKRLTLSLLYVLSPFQGFYGVGHLNRGFTPPSVFLRTFGAYSPDTNESFCWKLALYANCFVVLQTTRIAWKVAGRRHVNWKVTSILASWKYIFASWEFIVKTWKTIFTAWK